MPRRVLLPEELASLPRPRTPATTKRKGTPSSTVQLTASSSAARTQRRTSTGEVRKARKVPEAEVAPTPDRAAGRLALGTGQVGPGPQHASTQTGCAPGGRAAPGLTRRKRAKQPARQESDSDARHCAADENNITCAAKEAARLVGRR